MFHCDDIYSMQCLSLQKQLRSSVADEELWDCSAYVVGEVFRALRQSFANARGIQVQCM